MGQYGDFLCPETNKSKGSEIVSPEVERLCWRVGGLRAELHQRRTFSLGTLASRQSWMVDKRDAILVDFPAVPGPMLGRSMPVTALAKSMVYDGHFLVLESKMSFLLSNDLAELCDVLDCCC